ncbi:DoxX family protein [Luedemannella flava]
MIVRFAARHGIRLLRISIGVVFLWFAIPKYLPGVSPVDALVRHTVDTLTFHVVPGNLGCHLLAVVETGIGLGMLTGRLLRLTLVLLLLQMAGTLTPLLLFPREMFASSGVLTMEGQFIMKNLVIIAAGITLTATLRGGGLVASERAVRLDRESS